MSTLHSGQNEREVKRILNDHPREERTVLRNRRLLGCLSPLRAFGDCRFKLSFDQLNELEGKLYDSNETTGMCTVRYCRYLAEGSDCIILDIPEKLILPFYRSPPYLTASPQIRYHRIGVTDRAMVIARYSLF